MTFHRLTGILTPVSFDLHTGLNTVGRNPTNDVVIHEASVSSFHAEVTLDEHGVHVRDLQSTNGTFVNDEPVTQADVQPGQVLQFGSITFRLDAEQVTIQVPTLDVPSVDAPVTMTLPDVAIACSIRPDLPATHRCPKCERAYYLGNLRVMKMSGAAAVILFCPECSARVERIPGVSTKSAMAAARATPGGLMSRITQTIRLGFRRPR